MAISTYKVFLMKKEKNVSRAGTRLSNMLMDGQKRISD